MSTALRKPMTMTEFLDWEQRQSTKHEFDGVQPIAMAGGTLAHSALQRNLAIRIGGPLLGTACQFLTSDFPIRLDASVRYPDGVVVCGPQAGRALGTSEPVVTFEVLSAATAGTDRIVKTREYQATASVQRYVMLEQDRIAATVFSRTAHGWLGQVLAAGELLDMPEIGLSFPLDDLYTGVEPLEEPAE